MTAAQELADLKERLRAYVAELREAARHGHANGLHWAQSSAYLDVAEGLEYLFLQPPTPVDAEERRGYVNRWERGAGK